MQTGWMQDHTKLKVWQKAHALSVDLENLLARFPRGRAPGLRGQCLRAASSVPTNIVEGCGTDGGEEFVRFLKTSIASSRELEYHLLRLRDAGIITRLQHKSFHDRVIEVRKMLWGLIKAVRRNGRASEPETETD